MCPPIVEIIDKERREFPSLDDYKRKRILKELEILESQDLLKEILNSEDPPRFHLDEFKTNFPRYRRIIYRKIDGYPFSLAHITHSCYFIDDTNVARFILTYHDRNDKNHFHLDRIARSLVNIDNYRSIEIIKEKLNWKKMTDDSRMMIEDGSIMYDDGYEAYNLRVWTYIVRQNRDKLCSEDADLVFNRYEAYYDSWDRGGISFLEPGTGKVISFWYGDVSSRLYRELNKISFDINVRTNTEYRHYYTYLCRGHISLDTIVDLENIKITYTSNHNSRESIK